MRRLIAAMLVLAGGCGQKPGPPAVAVVTNAPEHAAVAKAESDVRAAENATK